MVIIGYIKDMIDALCDVGDGQPKTLGDKQVSVIIFATVARRVVPFQ